MENKQQELESRKGTLATQLKQARGGGGSEGLGAKPGGAAFEEFRRMEAKIEGHASEVEAHREVYEKEIEAFATVFTIVSMQKIGTSAVQSRATGGVAGGTYLFALPGSPGACRDAWDEILRWQLDSRHRPCNFVEILPRLEEHKRRK